MSTTPTNDQQLDSFDHALLGVLRQEVRDRSNVPYRRPARRKAYTAGGIAATVATAVGFMSLGSTASAYAVDSAPGGDITITIHRLDDAAGLQEDLAAYGINAEVDYAGTGSSDVDDTPDSSEPGQQREVPGSSTGNSGSFVSRAGEGGVHVGDGGCGGLSDPPLKASLEGGDYVITIPKGSALHDADAALRITTIGDLEKSLAGLSVSYTVDGVQCGVAGVSSDTTPSD